MRPKLWFGTQHHAQWVDAPLSGAEMSPEGWGAEGTYLSGGGFVRQSQDSHRQYIFEWSGASSRESAEIMQAYRDGVYSMSPNDLIYFYDPLIYDRNILPKRWAQPALFAPETGPQKTPLGVVSRIDTPPEWAKSRGLPFQGVSVSSTLPADPVWEDLDSSNSLLISIPPGYRLNVQAVMDGPNNEGLFLTDASGLVYPLSTTVPSGNNVRLVSRGNYDLYAVRAVLVKEGAEDPPGWIPEVKYAWVTSPGGSPTWRLDTFQTVNEVYNGGFEYFDPATGVPDYWEARDNVAQIASIHSKNLNLFENVGGAQGEYVGMVVTSAGAETVSVETEEHFLSSGFVAASGIVGATFFGPKARIGVKFRNPINNSEVIVWGPTEEVPPFDGTIPGTRVSVIAERPDSSYRRWSVVVEGAIDGTSGSFSLVMDSFSALEGDNPEEILPIVQKYRDGDSPPEGAPWVPGMGHSGCKFVGNPTWIANSGVDGGQIGYAATLKEVGDWQQ